MRISFILDKRLSRPVTERKEGSKIQNQVYPVSLEIDFADYSRESPWIKKWASENKLEPVERGSTGLKGSFIKLTSIKHIANFIAAANVNETEFQNNRLIQYDDPIKRYDINAVIVYVKDRYQLSNMFLLLKKNSWKLANDQIHMTMTAFKSTDNEVQSTRQAKLEKKSQEPKIKQAAGKNYRQSFFRWCCCIKDTSIDDEENVVRVHHRK